MSLVLNDRVRETTTIVGTGTATLLGAAAGYQSFSVIGNANTCYYTISDQAGTNWEVGIGTYVSATPALARTTVLSSSNAGALVSFPAGTKDVFVTYPAETAVSGGGGGTYPTVQPTLNLDFANSKTVDPRITFVRNNTATYYDGQTTAMAEQNLFLQSNTFSNAAWVATNGTVVSGITDPAGTTTAFSFTATGVATLYQTLTITATPYTLSFYIQRVTGTGAVNLTLDGTILTPQTITGSWARYSVTATPTAGTRTIGIQLAVITDSVNIFIAQLENRSSMTAANITTTAAITNYIPVLMTAPAGVPRLDYNPTTGVALGLLIEEQRANLLTYSSDFRNTADAGTTRPWAYSALSLTPDTMIAPDGTLSMDAMVSSGTGVIGHFIGQTPVFTGIGTITVYAKVGAVDWFYILTLGRVPTDGVSQGAAWFNLRTGAKGAITAGFTSDMVPVGNGVYRCTIVCTTSASANREVRYGSASANGFQTIDLPVGTVMAYIWGAQLEQGSLATSYIPTVASTVTRAADQASMTGTNFSSWYNQAQGSLYAEIDTKATYVGATIFRISDGGANNRIQLGSYTGIASRYLMVTSGANPFIFQLGTPTPQVKVAVTFIVGNYLQAVNGAYTTASTSILPLPIVNSINIGGDTAAQGELNGHIRKISYYPVALSSSNLVALTS